MTDALPDAFITTNSTPEGKRWIEIKCASLDDMHRWHDAILSLSRSPAPAVTEGIDERADDLWVNLLPLMQVGGQHADPQSVYRNKVAALGLLRAALSPTGTVGDGWREDPASDERWNAGVNYAIERLCDIFGVEPSAINWDAATETLNGDVMSVLCNVLIAAYGEEWTSNQKVTATIRSALSALSADKAEPVAWTGDDEAVEKVARAICAARSPTTDFDKLPDFSQAAYMTQAVAALAAAPPPASPIAGEAAGLDARDAASLKLAREVIEDMVRSGFIHSGSGSGSHSGYYVGENVVPIIMGHEPARSLPVQGEE